MLWVGFGRDFEWLWELLKVGMHGKAVEVCGVLPCFGEALEDFGMLLNALHGKALGAL